MSAPFRLDGWTFSSSAFDVLGDAAGYNAHEARGRWARAGSEATERQSYVFTEAAVRGLFGPRGVDALLAAELAEPVEGGLRMLRMDGSIEWFSDIASKRRRAGQARAANARRDERGRLLPASTPSTSPAHAGVLDQGDASTVPAQSSSPVPVPVPVLPEQGEPLDLKPPGRERSRRKPETSIGDWKPADIAPDLEIEFERFRNHALKDDRRCRDWSAAWRNWLLSPYRKSSKQSGALGPSKPHTEYPDTGLRDIG